MVLENIFKGLRTLPQLDPVRGGQMNYTDTGEKDVHHVHMCKGEPRTHKTDKQEFTIVDTVRFGEALFIDGAIQSTVADEALYHCPLVHGSAAFLEAGPRHALVIGGGEGCVARELLRYDTIENITQIDWDVDLVGYFKAEGRHWNGGTYEDARVEVIHEDVFSTQALEGTKRYDLIIMDLCDPDAGSIGLIKSLIVRLLGCLADGGVFIGNAGVVLPECISTSTSTSTSTSASASEDYASDLLAYIGAEPVKPADYHVFSYKIYVPSYMAPWCLIGLAPRNTIGDWVRPFICATDVRDWMNYDRSYNAVFRETNEDFMQKRMGDIDTDCWGC